MWFKLTGDERLGHCATQGCGGQPTSRLEHRGVGSNYCSGCREKIEHPEPKMTPYLIAHIVRGQPAFDIAERARCAICGGVGGHGVADFETGIVSDYEGADCDECDGEGYWWILSTCGYRARPYWSTEVSELFLDCSYGDETLLQPITDKLTPAPSPWPDLFSLNKSPEAKDSKRSSLDLLASLGLGKKSPPIKRRI